MPWGSVTVKGPAARDVHINGNYAAPAGKTNRDFVVEYGANTFETLDDRRCVDHRVQCTVAADQPHAEVTLAPVDPPEATAETPRDGDAGAEA